MDLRDQDDMKKWSRAPEIVALSVDGKNDLKLKLSDLKTALHSSDSNFSGMATASRVSFSPSRPFKLLFIVEDPENAIDMIEKITQDLETHSESRWNTNYAFYGEINCPGKLAFVFPGQGSQYPFMGLDLTQCFPEMQRSLAAADAGFDSEKKLLDYIYPAHTGKENEKAEFEEKLRSTDIAQPAIGAVSAAMLQILDRFGITADSTCGHSYGELTALFAAGRFDEATFLSLSAARGKYMAAAGGTGDKGGMLAVKAPLNRIDELIRSSGLDIILANRNSPDQGVLSGPTAAIEKMKTVCRENKIRALILPVSAAFHSKLVAAAAEPFKKEIASAIFLNARIPVYSNTTGLPYPDTENAAKKLLGRHLLNPVNFIEEIQNMYQDGTKIFVEVGPRTVLTGLINAILKDKPVYAMAMDGSSGRKSGITDLAKMLCMLSSVGYPAAVAKWKNPG